MIQMVMAFLPLAGTLYNRFRAQPLIADPRPQQLPQITFEGRMRYISYFQAGGTLRALEASSGLSPELICLLMLQQQELEEQTSVE